MSTVDFLAPFVEFSRTLCHGGDSNYVLGLFVEKMAKTLDLKGCLIKMKDQDGDSIKLIASYGLSERFLFSESISTREYVCSFLPEKTLCFSTLEDGVLRAERELMKAEGIQSFAVLPVDVERRPVATTALFAGVPREFSEDELRFAETLTRHCILSIIWKRRVDVLIEHERKYMESFQAISSAIAESIDIGKVLELVVTKVKEVLDVKGCVVRLLDPKTQNLYLAQSCGLSREFLQKGPVHAQQSIAENMSGRVVVIDDVFNDSRLQYPAELTEEGIRKVVSAPLMVRGKFIGALRIYTDERHSFNKRQINLITAIAQQCAFAIENARIYQRLKIEYQQMLMDFGYDGSSH